MSWVASGNGGAVYSIGDEYAFEHVPLLEQNQGWDWVAQESLRFWVEAPVFEELRNERWCVVQPEKIYLRSGLAMLPHCVSGSVRASGVCRPTSKIVDVGQWRVVVESAVPVGAVINGGSRTTMVRQRGASASFDVHIQELGSLYTWFTQRNCVVVGVGTVGLTDTTITYDENGVSYDPCR